VSKINVTNKTYPNIVIAYLFDKLLHPEDVSVGNELFDKFVIQLKKKGFLPIIRDYYLNMDSQDRLKYKLIKDGFEAITTSNTVIQIVPEKFEKKPETPAQKIKKQKGGMLRRVLKKLVASNELSKEEEYLIEDFLEEE
jgi:hypothetical protein